MDKSTFAGKTIAVTDPDTSVTYKIITHSSVNKNTFLNYLNQYIKLDESIFSVFDENHRLNIFFRFRNSMKNPNFNKDISRN